MICKDVLGSVKLLLSNFGQWSSLRICNSMIVFPNGSCHLVSYLISYKFGNFFSMSNVPQEAKARPRHLHQVGYRMELCNSICCTCFPALGNQSRQGPAAMGGWESPSHFSLASVSVLEQSFGRSGSGCTHAKGDMRAMFCTLPFAITLSVLVSNLEERDLMISHHPYTEEMLSTKSEDAHV